MGAAWQELPPPQSIPPKEDRDRKLPNGKSQNEEILKADYQKQSRSLDRQSEESGRDRKNRQAHSRKNAPVLIT
jgi:hypothetical protein